MLSWIMLAAFFGLVFLAALVGGRFRPDAWYDGLAKPAWQPPKWLFAPVWSLLYVMIAVAGWRLWRAGGDVALALWALQLGLNAVWSPLFFGWKRLDLALADLTLLWLALVATLVAAGAVDTIATLLLLPYFAWVSFAGALNFAVWRLNPVRQ
jgi:tryptophan-rich sensory protein